MKHPCGELPLEAVVLVDPLHRITAGGPPLASLLARATFKYARNDGSRGTYLPRSAGGKYLPHLTVGAAKFDDLKIIEAEPFDAFTVHPAGVAVYHLGNNGTARQLLKAWPVTNS